MEFGKQVRKLRVEQESDIDLGRWETCIDPLYESGEDYLSELSEFKEELFRFQEKLYASSDHALLIIFQGMDTSGKDGAISHIMSGVNPQGVFVNSFKVPSEDELKHDFLWRTHIRMPSRGQIGIFNRSYYEEVLVARVHPEILARERLPRGNREIANFWKLRLDDIRNHESYLSRQGIHVVKFFLHISKKEQRKRLLARIQKAEKNWKVSEGDFREREFWKEYVRAYEHCLSRTSTKQCPWFIVPADDKKNARILISRILLDEVSRISVDYPKLSLEQRRQLGKLKKML